MSKHGTLDRTRFRNDYLAARTGALLALLLGVSLAVGCGRKIGDACSTSVDCDPSSNSRTCDLSQPGGYCLVEGCDARSCPEDSFCLRFFPEAFLTAPTCEKSGDCNADELCLADSGRCVRQSLEKRVCVQVCGSDGDCRGGYVCQPTGIGGMLPLTLSPGRNPSYCRPKAAG